MKGNSDDKAVRGWFGKYLKASRSGDLKGVKSLLADDGLFLAPNGIRMDKETFAAAVTFDPKTADFKFEGKSEIEEVRVEGKLACVLSRTDFKLTPGGKYAGYSLSVLEKRDGKWVLVRDANTISPVAK